MKAEFQSLFAGDPDRDFCLRHYATAPTSLSQFRQDLARLKSLLEQQDADSYLLHSSDAYQFAVGFFALLGMKKRVVVCANSKPRWIEHIAEEFDVILSDSNLLLEGKPCLSLAAGRDTGAVWEPEITGEEKISFYTSGSTGAPKAIEKSLDLLLIEVSYLERQFGKLLSETLFLGSVPHCHFYGLIFRLFWPACSGRLWLAEQIVYQEQLLSIAEAAAAVSFVSSPSFLSRLDKNLPRASLEKIFSAGSPLSFSAAQDSLAQFGQLPIEVYGSTETGAIGHRQQATGLERWQAMSGIRLDETRHGIALSSPFLGAKESVLLDDRLTLYGNEQFDLLGRNDRVVKVAEHRLSLTEIENVMASLDDVDQCIAFVLPTAENKLACMVVAAHPVESLEKERDLTGRWKRALRESLNDVTVPKKWRVVREIPVTSMGKTDWDKVMAYFSTPQRSAGFDLPIVLERQETDKGGKLELFVSRGLNGFEGHFDRAPVLPGVVQLLWVIALVKAQFPELLGQRKEALHSVKYHNIIQPGDIVELTLSVNKDSLEFIYGKESKRYSSGKYKLSHV